MLLFASNVVRILTEVLQMGFAEKLKELRSQQKISQEELAKALGVSRSTIAGYETKSREPDLSTLVKIAAFFNVSVDYLLDSSEDSCLKFKLTNEEKKLLRNISSLTPNQLAKLNEFLESLKENKE